MEDVANLKGSPLVFPAMFRLLYCCGLRCKETRTLAYKNLHLNQGYLDIIRSKGPKSRRVYISVDLAGYLSDYDRRISFLFPGRLTFFPNRNDAPYSPAVWNRISCVSGMLLFQRRRTME
ncbi:tyrosine-type recombinase/integrase [Hungatella sp. SB206]|uniref:tyrosine-type recombinase/integrase n=1 Tax=Hungatella sp. SB206 TaxID=2937758 RepID=UPI003DA83B8C